MKNFPLFHNIIPFHEQLFIVSSDLNHQEIHSLLSESLPHANPTVIQQLHNYLTKQQQTFKQNIPVTFNLKGIYNTQTVFLNQKQLSPLKSLKLINHSPTGFSWGYAGSGPAQLALAICIELFGPFIAYKSYQNFKRKFIATLPQNDFHVTLNLNSHELMKTE